jgi:long-chain acyl-CoA synthetase
MTQHPKVVDYYAGLVNKLNPNFSKVEQIKKFNLVEDAWDVQTGELTPTMKLKRRVILEKYKKQIESMYA